MSVILIALSLNKELPENRIQFLDFPMHDADVNTQSGEIIVAVHFSAESLLIAKAMLENFSESPFSLLFKLLPQAEINNSCKIFELQNFISS